MSRAVLTAAAAAGVAVTIGIVSQQRKRLKRLAAARRLVRGFLDRNQGDDGLRIVAADAEAVAQKVAAFMEGGVKSLAITADWDRTLTAGTSVSSHGVLETCEALGADFRAASSKNTKKYLPIEQDPTISIADKLPHMQAWYRLNHALIVKCGIDRSEIGGAVRSSLAEGKLKLRPGALDLLRRAAALQLPALIFSAGLADIIQEVLAQRADPAVVAAGSSVGVVSNRMLWSSSSSSSSAGKEGKEGKEGRARLVGFSEPLIHMFNKNCSAVPVDLQPHKPPRWKGGPWRRHALVLGDGVGDAAMVDGALAPPEAVLRVGFLNYNEPEKHLAKYSRTFDLVLVGPSGDADMAPVLEILDLITTAEGL